MKVTTLPITAFRSRIVDTVKNNAVTIITAETGAGKSTQVPQYLLDEGYDLVVTQPRRLAARTVAQRVAEEIGQELGGIVGYRTAIDRQDSPATRCLFCTDGLALVRELMGANKGILVLDEVHEWNEKIEVLVAWVKRQIEAGANFKVVLMSATLESEKLAAFYNGAPVISVPGRLFPVEVRTAQAKMIDDVAALVRDGRNVLVFQPGKQEISEMVTALEQMGVSAEVLSLHGDLTPQEQARCFKHYRRPKVVVSTNVAQTSVTIDDIDAVVDSGLERRIELVNGVEGLYLKPISLADAEQRKGRAGRTKAGIYIDHCNKSERPDFPVAEILRKRLDQTVLRLAIAGFDMEELEFFHQPAKSEIHDAKRALVALGCMSENRQVTQVGRLINKLPVSVQYGRMLVEANKLGVVDDVITVAAILEQGGITIPPPSFRNPDRPNWRRMVPHETESDVMGQLCVWNMADTMSRDEMHKRGVSLKNFFRAKEMRQHLAQAVKQFFPSSSTGRREDILKAVCSGMVDHLYQGSYGWFTNGEKGEYGEPIARKLDSNSLVVTGYGVSSWLVGKPFDLEIKKRWGQETLRLVGLASKVDPMWLVEIAPQLVQRQAGVNARYDVGKNCVISTTQILFNGQVVQEVAIEDPDHPEATSLKVDYLFSSFQPPPLPVVDMNEDAVIPPVVEHVIGTHPETGENLTVYGTCYRTYLWDHLRVTWVRSKSEAETLRNSLVEELAKRQEILRSYRRVTEHTRVEQAPVKPAPAPVETVEPVSLHQVDLSKLFGGNVRRSR
jgi:HrpA-like RNA helicase